MEPKAILAEYKKLKPHDAVTVTRDGKAVTFEFRYCDQYDGDRDVVTTVVKRVSEFTSLRASNVRDANALQQQRQALIAEIAVIDAIAAEL